MNTSAVIAVGAVVLIAMTAVGAVMLLSKPSGTLAIQVTDSPGIAPSHLYMNISDIMLQGDGHSSVRFKVSGGHFDLLGLVNVTQTLGSNVVPAGNYTLIRFNVTSAIATIGGENITLTVPSGELKVSLHPHLQVRTGETTNVVLDITADMTNISQSGNLTPHVNVKNVTYGG